MPRTLPWLVEAAKEKEAKRAKSTAPMNSHSSYPDDVVDEDLNPIYKVTPKPRKARHPQRSPSTSPPPAPPDIELMREGFEEDDIWQMVEDEFFTTAQKLTQYIHRAEYDRLRRLARSRGDRTLRDIVRPTDVKTEQSTDLKMRLEAEARAQKTKDGLKMLLSDESEEDDAYMQDAQLAGLMTGSQAAGHDLTGIAKARLNTRAAAGYERSPRKPRPVLTNSIERIQSRTCIQRRALTSETGEEEESDGETESDDLDVGVTSQKPVPPKTKSPFFEQLKLELKTNGQDISRKRNEDKHVDGSLDIFKRFAASRNDHPRAQRKAITKECPPLVNKSRSPSNLTSSSSMGNEDPEQSKDTERQGSDMWLAKRRAARAKRKEQDQSKHEMPKVKRSNDIDVPMWL